MKKSKRDSVKSQSGEPIQVLVAEKSANGRTTFHLDNEKLESLLMHPNVRSKKVVVVSVAGAFRQGKSFLLDFFLRYLQSEGNDQWIGDPNTPLTGFPWRGGAERDTTGILMWSEPFLRTLPNGDQVAVLLMDTQGAFDSRSTVRESATVFALSTMLSSIQVFNVSGNIQEDHLQHLQLFTEYGRLALKKGKGTPFQHLKFLVRDWPYPYEYAYGAEGGKKLITKRLQPDANQPEELQKIREHLWSCFQKIDCFLMPHPGLEVATNPKFDGRIENIHKDFVLQMQQFVPLLLSNENLIVKQINSQELRGRDLLQYFISYTNIYQGDEIPEPKTVLQATAEANNLTALANAKDYFSKEMDKICGASMTYMNSVVVEKANEKIYEEAMKQFDDCPKMGGKQSSQKYREQLDGELKLLGEQYRKNNAQKNAIASFYTLFLLLGFALGDFILWEIFALLGLSGIQTITQLLFLTICITMTIWIYLKVSGNNKQLMGYIDKVADTIYNNFVQPILQKVLKNDALPPSITSSSSTTTTVEQTRQAASSSSNRRKND